MENLEKKIAALGKPKKYGKNAFLFQAQQDALGFYYVLKGEVRVFKMDESGREVEVVRLEPGDFFGEAIAFASTRFSAFAQATRETEVLYFEKKNFFEKLEKDTAIAKFFLILLAKKCLVLNERIESLGLRTVRQRLVQYLLSQCQGEKGCLIELKIKKSELAQLLGTISETLSRNLRKMQEEGLVEVTGKRIRVKDCLKMRAEISR
jgi:CRP/FNR family transcriptional regulator